MQSTEIHTCPRCAGAINREHYAEARFEYYTDRFLYCEFCEMGWETSEYRDGEAFTLEYVARIEPVNFGKFLQRLEGARAA